MPRVSATLAFVEDTGRSDEEKKKAVVALAGCSVHAAQVLAVLEIARNGFHRADVVNLQWNELTLTFTGHARLARQGEATVRRLEPRARHPACSPSTARRGWVCG